MRSFMSFTNSSMIKSLITGVMVSVGLIAILMCAVTVLLLTASLLPYEYLSYIMIFIDGVSVLTGGYISARINKSQGMMLGASTGFVVFLAMIICGFCTSTDTLSILTLIRGAVIIICGAIGGIKGVNVKEKIRIK